MKQTKAEERRAESESEREAESGRAQDTECICRKLEKDKLFFKKIEKTLKLSEPIR